MKVSPHITHIAGMLVTLSNYAMFIVTQTRPLVLRRKPVYIAKDLQPSTHSLPLDDPSCSKTANSNSAVPNPQQEPHPYADPSQTSQQPTSTPTVAPLPLLSQEPGFPPKVVEFVDPPYEVITKPILDNLALTTKNSIPYANHPFSSPMFPTITYDDSCVSQKSDKHMPLSELFAKSELLQELRNFSTHINVLFSFEQVDPEAVVAHPADSLPVDAQLASPHLAKPFNADSVIHIVGHIEPSVDHIEPYVKQIEPSLEHINPSVDFFR